MLLQQRQGCFCAFCKSARNVYKSKHLSVMGIVGLIGLSFVLAEIIWSDIDPRGLFIFSLMLVIGELFAQIKWRQSMICNNCGFDLVMYKKSPEQAAAKIKEYMVIRSEQPQFLLRPALPVNKSKKGTKLSLQV